MISSSEYSRTVVTCANDRGARKTLLRGGRNGACAAWRLAAAFIAVAASFGAAPVSAQETPVAVDAAPARDAARETRSGWLKTFAAAPIDTGARFEAPDYFGSLVEEEARKAMRAGLLARGLLAAETDDPAALAFSVHVDEPKPASKRPPKSRLRLESVETDPTDNIRDPEVRPFISFGPSERNAPATPMIAVTIYARRGDERVWSGYAAAAPDGAGRAAIARALTDALIARFGESVDIPDFSLTLPASAPDNPVQNGLSE